MVTQTIGFNIARLVKLDGKAVKQRTTRGAKMALLCSQ